MAKKKKDLGINLRFCKFTEEALLKHLADTLKELRRRNLFRSNLIGDIGVNYVVSHYESTPHRPKLKLAAENTKFVDALGTNGQTYSIKTTTTGRTGEFSGIENLQASKNVRPVFDFLIVAHLSTDFELLWLYEFSFETFMKYSKECRNATARYLRLSSSTLNECSYKFQK